MKIKIILKIKKNELKFNKFFNFNNLFVRNIILFEINNNSFFSLKILRKYFLLF